MTDIAAAPPLERYYVEVTGFSRHLCIYVHAASAEAAEADVLDRLGFKVEVTLK